MSTIYMSQLSTLPLMEGDQDQGHFPAFHLLAKDPPILFPFMINSPVEHQGQSYGDQHLRHQVLGESNQQFNDHMMMGGSDAFPTRAQFRPTIRSIGSDMIQRSSYHPYDIEDKRADGSASKWTSTTPPAKMRIVRKATNDPEGGAARKPRRRAQAYQADESQQQQQQQAMGVIRVCSDCNTTKTPLWRSGPCGPKSLCNACGIRQRKARRAMAAAAAAAANGGAAGAGTAGSDASQAKPVKKEKRADVDRSLPFKKRCKMVDHAAAAAPATAAKAEAGAAAPKKDRDHVGENVEAGLSKAGPPPAFFHGFPRDEITDAAMLLMTLSCGLVRS